MSEVMGKIIGAIFMVSGILGLIASLGIVGVTIFYYGLSLGVSSLVGGIGTGVLLFVCCIGLTYLGYKQMIGELL